MDETCVICGDPLEGKATYTAALIFGNKSRDPHVGPYCKNCVPPAIAKTVKCVENCPLVDERWIPVDGNCITKHKRYPHTRIKCEFCLGMSPVRNGISCIHPDRLKEKREEKQARLMREAEGLEEK